MRTKTNFDADWKFKLAAGELREDWDTYLKAADCRVGVPAQKFDDTPPHKDFRTVSLPHDFVVEAEFIAEETYVDKPGHTHHTMHGSRPGGIGWYRKRFTIPPISDIGCRFYLLFDGIFRDARIYLNEFLLARHPSGYTPCCLDVTDFLNYGDENAKGSGHLDNLLVVRADSTRPEGWFYEGGGIYRHVWLIKTHAVHIPPHGTFVSSSVDLAKKRATVTVQTDLANRLLEKADLKLTARLLDPAGKEVARLTTPVSIPGSSDTQLTQTLAVANPQLWSLESPHLYTVESSIELAGQTVDTCTTPTGIRHIRFDVDQGFFLNGQPVKIQGVCCHQDHAGVGVALPDGLQTFRLQRLKDMGANAYRCSHNPPTPELLDACDKLGMLVMDENRRLSSAPFEVADLESMIRRDRNHPSVFMWSIGNEEFHTQWTAQSIRITKTLREKCHQLDPTRPVTLAICCWNQATNKTEPIDNMPWPCAELDVMGFNYAWDHWDDYYKLHPNQPIVISEASSNMRTRSCARSVESRSHVAWDDPKIGRDAEEQWALIASRPYLSGIFIWTGFDYRGEPNPYRYPAVSSQFGPLDTCGFPKDNFYYYRAGWTAEPLVHIFPHWNHAGREGQPITVYAYSNCDEVELFVNGHSQGKKPMPRNGHLDWPAIPYAPGKIAATGFRNGQPVANTRVETTGNPHALKLTPHTYPDVTVIDVAVVDDQGRVVPTAENHIVFDLGKDSPAPPPQILGVGNGDPGSHEADKANHRRAFAGLCQVIVQPGKEIATLAAASPGLVSAKLEIAARA